MASTLINDAVTASIAIAVDQAIEFIVLPLARPYRAAHIIALQFALQPVLREHCRPTWDLARPRSGSGRRCLTFTPGAAPPRPIFEAAIAAGIDVALWVSLLTQGSELELFIDPGRVTVSESATHRTHTVWALEEPAQPVRPTPIYAPAPTKTYAQVIDAQEDADELFALINEEQAHTPQQAVWLGPTLDAFPVPPARSDSRASAASTHSRSSSFSSLSSSSGASFSSVGSDDSGSTASSSQSRRERARGTKVFVDASKKEVTPYDGGKTTVLTGGVMLGAKPTTPKATAFAPAARVASWRRA